MEPKQTILQRIISQINASINNYATNKMQRRYDYDRTQVAYDMRDYGYKTVGEYARTKLIKNIFTRDF